MGLARYCVCGWLVGVGEHRHDQRMVWNQIPSRKDRLKDAEIRADDEFYNEFYNEARTEA